MQEKKQAQAKTIKGALGHLLAGASNVLCHKTRKRASHCKQSAKTSKVCHTGNEVVNFYKGCVNKSHSNHSFDPDVLLAKNARRYTS